MSDSVTIEDSKGETFAEVIDIIGVSEVKKAFQQSVKEGSLHNWFKGSKSKNGEPGWVNVVTKKKMNEDVKRDEYGDPIGGPKISKKQKAKNLAKNEPDRDHTTDTAESVDYIDLPLEVEIPNTDATFKLGLMFRESLEINKGMLFIFEEVGKRSFHMRNTRIPLDIAFVKEDGTIESIKELTPYSSLPVYSDGEVLFAIEANRGWFTENNVEVGDEIVLGEENSSGTLVKYRKKGAAKCGNKSESVEIDEAKMEKSYISNVSKADVRNQRRFGKKGSATPQGYFGQKPSEKAELAVKRGEEHKARRGVKTKGMKEGFSNWRSEIEDWNC